MTKNPRDERVWTNRELQEDSAGYLAAQQARREDEALAKQKRRDADDLERFTEAFVAAGGKESDARAAFKARRNEQAALAAAAAEESADTAAAKQSRLRIRQAL
jgi:hypothetical protein